MTRRLTIFGATADPQVAHVARAATVRGLAVTIVDPYAFEDGRPYALSIGRGRATTKVEEGDPTASDAAWV